METTDFINIKDKNDKEKIVQWINTNNVFLKDFSKDEIIDAVSLLKVNLNEVLSEIDLIDKTSRNNYLVQKDKSAVAMLDEMVNMFNSDEEDNKIRFRNFNASLRMPLSFKNYSLSIEDFNFDIPISFKLEFFTVNGISKTFDIIPFNYQGLYSEFITVSEDETTFETSDINPIFYSAIYNGDGFSIGRRLNWKEGREFFIDKKIKFNRENIGDIDFIVKYVPVEKSYETFINDTVTNVKLIVENDFLNIKNKLYSKLVIA